MSPAPRRVAKPGFIALLMGALFASQLGCSQDLPAFERIILELESARPESNANIVHLSVIGRVEGSEDDPLTHLSPDTGEAKISVPPGQGALYDRPFHLDLTDFLASFEGEDVQVAVRAYALDGDALTGGQVEVQSGAQGAVPLRLTADDLIGLMVAVCDPEDELCDGLDNDCDGETDEDDMDIPCDDGIPCTSDSCSEGGCVHEAETSCNDEDPCTSDVCEPGHGCRNEIDVQICPGCFTDSDCVNTNVCTTTTCKACSAAGCPPGFQRRCETKNIAAFCDDGDACTTPDQCDAGNCVSGPPKPCADGIGCTIDSCKGSTGVCSSTGADLSPSCNDGVGCTLDGCDVEQGCFFDPSQCTCQTDEKCPDDGNPCTAQVCEDGICVVEDEPQGAPCVAEIACASTVACDGNGACAIDKLAAIGTLCDDFDACTSEDQCDPDGACIGGIPVELCNSLDDDCDLRVDEGIIGIDDPCDSVEDGDYCQDGIKKCDDEGELVCEGDSAAPAELCNGSDEDCDDKVDEGFDVGLPCGENEGKAGCFVLVCDPNDNQATKCLPIIEALGVGAGQGPAAETIEACNDIDDDCDGLIDEGLAGCGVPTCELESAHTAKTPLKTTALATYDQNIVIGTASGVMILNAKPMGGDGASMVVAGALPTTDPVYALAYAALWDLLIVAHGESVTTSAMFPLLVPEANVQSPNSINIGSEIVGMVVLDGGSLGSPEPLILLATASGLQLYVVTGKGAVPNPIAMMPMDKIKAVVAAPVGFAGSQTPVVAVILADPMNTVVLVSVSEGSLTTEGAVTISNPRVAANVGANEAIFIVGAQDGELHQVSYSAADSAIVSFPLEGPGNVELVHMATRLPDQLLGDLQQVPLVVSTNDGALRAAWVTVDSFEEGYSELVVSPWSEIPILGSSPESQFMGVSIIPTGASDNPIVVSSDFEGNVNVSSMSQVENVATLETLANWNFDKEAFRGVQKQGEGFWLTHQSGLVEAVLTQAGEVSFGNFIPLAGQPQAIAVDPQSKLAVVAFEETPTLVLDMSLPASPPQFVANVHSLSGPEMLQHLTALGSGSQFLGVGESGNVFAFLAKPVGPTGPETEPWPSMWAAPEGKAERALPGLDSLFITTNKAQLHQCPYSLANTTIGPGPCPFLDLFEFIQGELQVHDMAIRKAPAGIEVYLALGEIGIGRVTIDTDGSVAESSLKLLEGGSELGFVTTLSVQDSWVWFGTEGGLVGALDASEYATLATLQGNAGVGGLAPTIGGVIVARTDGVAENLVLTCQ
jgi:hypothetical protein